MFSPFILDSLSMIDIDVIPALHDYLLSCRYIEELQKFLEDDNFKLSLRLEPPQKTDSQSQHNQSNGKVQKSCSTFYTDDDIKEEELGASGGGGQSLEKSLQVTRSTPVASFIPSHRKSRSLGSNALLDSISNATVKQVSLHDRTSNGNRKSIQSSMENDPPRTRLLIDDSVMDETAEEGTGVAHTPPRRGSVDFSIGNSRLVARGSSCSSSKGRNGDLHEEAKPHDQVPLIRIMENPMLGEKRERKNGLSQNEAGIMFEGYVKRKTILKEGKKPAFSVWIRYWLILRSNHTLHYHPAKSVQGCSKDKFRKRNSKSTQLSCGWLAMAALNEEDSFTLADANRRNIYLFKTNGSEEAALWCQSLAGLNQSFTADNSKTRNRAMTASPGLRFAI